jgi:dephospho-CoA kinase
MFRPGREPSEDDMVAAPLLRIALILEENVRRVVREILVVAAQEAADREAKWLRLSEHVEEDEQRAARDAVLELARTLGTDTGDADGQPAAGVGLSKLIASLLRTETQLAEVRGALEDRLPRTSESEPGGPV